LPVSAATVAAMWPAPTLLGDSTALCSVEALDALCELGLGPSAVRMLCQRYRTWGELSGAATSEVMQVGGLRSAVRVQPWCPPVRESVIGVLVGFADPNWPGVLDGVDDPPPLLEAAGAVGSRFVAVAGNRHPSGLALRVVDTIVAVARERQAGVAVVADGIGSVVARRALGRVPVLLVSYGDAPRGSGRELLGGPQCLSLARSVVAEGGCALQLRGRRPLSESAARAVRSAVAFSDAVVLLEPGVGTPELNSAVAAARGVQVPVVASGSLQRIERSLIGYPNVPSFALEARSARETITALL
jgi:hypothetical protein